MMDREIFSSSTDLAEISIPLENSSPDDVPEWRSYPPDSRRFCLKPVHKMVFAGVGTVGFSTPGYIPTPEAGKT
jgi:hypothetical protein